MKLIPKLVFLAILVAAILSITLVWGLITDISLVDPANNAWVNTTSPQFVFRAISDTDPTFSCNLWTDGFNNGYNNSVLNNTDTALVPLFLLSDGSHSWHISCVDSNLTIVNSETRTINVDTEKPVVTLLEPDDGDKFSTRDVDFQFKVEDNLDDELFCELYVDGNKEEDGNVDNDTAVTWTINDLSRDTHNWYVSCEDEAGNNGTSLTWSFEIEEIGYCEYGEQGSDLDFTLKSPDDGDDFSVGDEIEVKVEVENNANENLDVVVEAELYDLDDDDSVIDTDYEFELKEDDTETITLTLKIPSTVDEDNDFVVNVKVYEDNKEDEQCKEDSVDVDIERKSHDVSIKDIYLNTDSVACGGSFTLYLGIENNGANDEDIKIKVFSSVLDIDFNRTLFLDKGEDYTTNLLFNVPKNIQEGNYLVDVTVYFDYYDNSYHESVSEDLQIKVEGNCPPPAMSDVSFILSQVGDVFANYDFTTKVSITNTGNVETTYTVDVSDYDEWATLNKVSPESLTLNPGSTGYVYVALKPKEEAYGMYSFKVKVSFDGKTEEQSMSVDVKRRSEAAAAWEKIWFEMKRYWGYALFNLALIIAIIVLIIYTIKLNRGKRRKVEKPTEIKLRPLKPEWKPKTKTRKKKR